MTPRTRAGVINLLLWSLAFGILLHFTSATLARNVLCESYGSSYARAWNGRSKIATHDAPHLKGPTDITGRSAGADSPSAPAHIYGGGAATPGRAVFDLDIYPSALCESRRRRRRRRSCNLCNRCLLE